MFPGDSNTFNSFDSAEDDTNNYYQEEYLNTLTPNGLPPHRYLQKYKMDLQSWRASNKIHYDYTSTYLNKCRLELKENAHIMLLRNLDPSNGLCNGTRMICRGFAKNVVHAEISSGHCATKHIFIPRIQLSPPENEGYPFKFIRKQFSVRLCFEMTINIAKGKKISNVGLYLSQHVFSHGQL